MPRFRLRHALLALIIFVALALLWLLSTNRETAEAPPISEEIPQTEADLSLQDVDYTRTRDGKRHWRLKAETAEYRKEDGVTRAQKVEMTFFDAQEQPRYTLRADHGSMNDKTQEVEVWGQVVITDASQWRCETERLYYASQSGVVSTPLEVQITSPGRRLTGVGMRYDMERQRLEIQSKARAWIQQGMQWRR